MHFWETRLVEYIYISYQIQFRTTVSSIESNKYESILLLKEWWIRLYVTLVSSPCCDCCRGSKWHTRSYRYHPPQYDHHHHNNTDNVSTPHRHYYYHHHHHLVIRIRIPSNWWLTSHPPIPMYKSQWILNPYYRSHRNWSSFVIKSHLDWILNHVRILQL